MNDTGCPDGGACHHSCGICCFRVMCCGPMGGVFPGDRWPAELVAEHDPANGDDPDEPRWTA